MTKEPNTNDQSIFRVLNYEGSKMTFKTENGITFINATEMARPFNKQPKDWLRLKSSKDFMKALLSTRRISLVTDLVGVVNGGLNPGTWMHEDAALEFARWLSPAFAIWCNDRLKELFLTGTTSIAPVKTPSKLEYAKMLVESEERYELLTKINAEQEEQLQISSGMITTMAPKAEYVDQVLGSDDLFTITQIAKDLNITALKLNRVLFDLKIQFKVGQQWVLYSKHDGKGYTGTQTYVTPNGGTKMATKWTQKGRAFIIDQLRTVTSVPNRANTISLSNQTSLLPLYN